MDILHPYRTSGEEMYPVQAEELHQANQHAWASANQSQSPSVAKALTD
jgi:hypothetical protein